VINIYLCFAKHEAPSIIPFRVLPFWLTTECTFFIILMLLYYFTALYTYTRQYKIIYFYTIYYFCSLQRHVKAMPVFIIMSMIYD